MKSRKLAVTVFAFLLAACSKDPVTVSPRGTVSSLQKGDVISELNRANAVLGAGISGKGSSESGGSGGFGGSVANPTVAPTSLLPPEGGSPVAPARQAPVAGGTQMGTGGQAVAAPDSAAATVGLPTVADPCPQVAHPSSASSSNDSQEAYIDLLACLRDTYRLANDIRGVVEYLRTSRLDPGDRLPSTLTDQGLGELAMSTNQRLDPAKARTSVSDRELDEIAALGARRRQALKVAEAGVLAAFEARPALLASLSANTAPQRGRLLAIMLREARQDIANPGSSDLPRRFSAFVTELSNILNPDDARLYFPADLLQLLGLPVVMGKAGHELAVIDSEHDEEQNPYMPALIANASQQGSPEITRILRETYVHYRDTEKPPIPAHDAPDPQAARVAFLDTGVDFANHQLGLDGSNPSDTLRLDVLGAYLGNGPGQLRSHDYADGGDNPYAPALWGLGHGSTTTATIMTLMAQQAPELLNARKLDLAMWKVAPYSNLLAGNWFAKADWNGKPGAHVDAIKDQISRALAARAGQSDDVVPQIVSVSMEMKVRDAIQSSGTPDLLRRAPWLWVMAAGNRGRDLRHVPSDAQPGCFGDVDANNLDLNKILCVGAIDRGRNGEVDRIAGYSNFGPRVDVYAYATYTDFCPNGTSCAAPAITAAAAILKGTFPSLTARQIKQVILEASVSRTLEVEADDAPAGTDTRPRTIQVFDPTTMMKNAIEIARRHLTARGA